MCMCCGLKDKAADIGNVVLEMGVMTRQLILEMDVKT